MCNPYWYPVGVFKDIKSSWEEHLAGNVPASCALKLNTQQQIHKEQQINSLYYGLY